MRSIHNLESSYFRTKFESTLDKFEGATSGIGVISDTYAQPLIMNSHLGRFAICTVAKIVNKDELTQLLLEKNMHFAEMSSGSTNPTELVALLIIQGKTFREGIENVFHHIKGSCTMMILTEDGIICARDSWGRTPIIIGKKEGAYAASSETTSFPNLDYETAYEHQHDISFRILDVLKVSLKLVNTYVKSYNIKVTKNIDKDVMIYGEKNIFIQVILSILQNSLDAFKIRRIYKPWI